MTAAASVIAVDGPSGSGKGTLAVWLARRLGWHLLDSGALYRIVAWSALARGTALDAEAALAALAATLAIRFEIRPSDVVVWADGIDVGDAIRTEAVGAAASQVAALPAVRRALLAAQHAFAVPPGLVADGRDMGTVVFPGAALKIYLDASPEERAARRYKQLKDKDLSVSLRALISSIRERDERDRSRVVSPLKPAHDAVLIDSSGLSVESVCAMAWRCVIERGLAAAQR